MTVPPHRSSASSFEVVVTAMLIGCLVGAGIGATVGALTRESEPAEIGLLAAVGLLGGCVAGGLMGTAWCVARRRRRAAQPLPVPPAGPTVERLPPPDDRRPGWHADPAGTGRRLWDGERWTQHVWSDRGRST
jgi:Protein of unknown function (DUF2510)